MAQNMFLKQRLMALRLVVQGYQKNAQIEGKIALKVKLAPLMCPHC